MELCAAAFAPAAAARLAQVRKWTGMHQDQAIVKGSMVVGAWLPGSKHLPDRLLAVGPRARVRRHVGAPTGLLSAEDPSSRAAGLAMVFKLNELIRRSGR